MKLSQITSLKVCTEHVYVDQPRILVYIPDTSASATSIYHTGLLLHNCEKIITKSNIIKIPVVNLTINCKKLYYKLKKDFQDMKSVKKLHVVSSLNSVVNKKSSFKNTYFIFLDIASHNMLSSDKVPDKLLFQLFLEYVHKNYYNHIKKIVPKIDVDIILGFNNNNGRLLNLFKEYGTVVFQTGEISKLPLFDNYIYASDLNDHFLPIVNKNRGKNQLIRQQLSKLIEFINSKEKENVKIVSDEEGLIVTNKLANKETNLVSAITEKLSKQKLTASIDPDTKQLEINIDTKTISKVLKKYKINDPNIVINAKAAIVNYIKETKQQPPKDVTEILLLKAINKTVHGTDKLDEKYVRQPQLLLKKLNEINVYQNKLEMFCEYPSVNPHDIVDLTYTTGQFRHQFEFEDVIHENIKKLFKSLENRANDPVKIVKIKYEIVDTNVDRYIEYTITMKNLTGKNKQPYDVTIRVPALVNERYFKIGGKTYIIPSQQFFKPLTKTEKNEVRLLTNYAIARIILANVILDITNFKKIIGYIQTRYKNKIKEVTDTKIVFKNGEIIDINNEILYTSKDKEVIWNAEDNKLYRKLPNGERQELKLGKYEFIYMKLSEITGDNFTKNKIAYFLIHLGGQKMPFILFLMSQKDILKILLDYGIDYKIVKDASEIDSVYVLSNDKDEYLVMHPQTPKEKYLLNGLIVENVEHISSFNNAEAGRDIVNSKISRGSEYIDHMIQNMIDPVTKELLEYENLPTNMVNLLQYNAIDKLLNDPIEHMSDLGIYRVRMSELILNLLYSQIMRAHKQYSEVSIQFHPEEAKIYFDPDFVIKNLITEGKILQYTGTISPVQEVMLASRVTRLGKGGIPTDKAIKIEHRNIHESHIGNMSANSTSESSGVGIITHHTLTPVIVNRYGSYGGIDLSASGWHFVSADEALIPFGNQIASDRMVLAVTHCKQVTPTDNIEPPLVQTGAEYIIPSLTSSRFIHRAKNDGEVLEVVKNKYIKVKYKNGKIDYLDIVPRVGHTKRFEHILIELNTLKLGDKFKKNQPIAWCKNFDKSGIYCSGKNLKIAVMEYQGYVHEDAYAISRKYAETTTTDIIKEVHVIIPNKSKISVIETEIGKITKPNEILLSYTYDEEFDEYVYNFIENVQQDDGDETIDDETQLYTLSGHTVELKSPGGEIVDIKVYLNSKQNVDTKLKQLHSQLVKDTVDLIEKLKHNTEARKNPVKAIDNLDISFFQVGGHKYKGAEFKGVRIVYYIKIKKPIREHDKLSNRFGAKGVVGYIFDETPRAEKFGELDIFISPIGIFSRKNVAMLKEIYLGKIFYILNAEIQKMANDQKVKTAKIKQLILVVYKKLGIESVAKSMENILTKYPDNKFRKDVKDGKFKLFAFVPPFQNITIKQIRDTADMLKIQLDEKVYIPELDTWTNDPVPVGISYYQALEHYSDVYANVRSAEKYVGLTGQPTKGKSKQGALALGNLEIYSLISVDAKDLLDELISVRSDDHSRKKILYNTILQKGEATLPRKSEKIKPTEELLDVYMTTLGLEVNRK